MVQFYKKVIVSAAATLALAGACLAGTTQTTKADEVDGFKTEFVAVPKKDGYQELVTFLLSVGVDEEDAEFYLIFKADKDFATILSELKSQSPEEVKNKVEADVERGLGEVAPITGTA